MYACKSTIMTSKQSYYLGILLLALALCSCEDVIDLKLSTAEPKYVIEGKITDRRGDCRVSITQTKDFTSDNQFEGITGATVTLTDNNGNISVLEETEPGIYRDSLLVASPGGTYTLNVTISQQTFSATSAMPQPVSFDSLYITNDLLFGEYWLTSNVEFRDPPGALNYYNFIQWVNGQKTREFYPANDEYTDGNRQTLKLYMPDTVEDEDKIKSGDSVRIEMQCVDAPIYQYWFSAQQSATGSNESAAPSNPVSNIQGDALGYFSAHTVQIKTIIVP